MTPPARANHIPRTAVVAWAWFVPLLAASLIVSFLPLPWSLAGLATSVGALGFAVVAAFGMRRGATSGLWSLAIMGVVIAGFATLGFGSQAILYDQVAAYQQCSRDAITIGAAKECERAFEAASQARLEELQQSLERRLGKSPG